jgi:hypothetical protein
MKSRFAVIFGVVSLSACQTNGTQVAGPEPTVAAQPARVIPSNWRSMVLQAIKESVRDPYSIRSAEVSPPETGFVGLLNGGSALVACARFNAKNGFGAYAGITSIAFIIEDGKPAKVLAYDGQRVPIACKDRTYSPFPEAEKIT